MGQNDCDESALPSNYSRAAVIAASRVLGDLGHAEIDDCLLGWGVRGLQAGRDAGSRQARANLIGTFIVEHPDVCTADGVPLGDAVVERAWFECDANPGRGETPEGARRDRLRALLAGDQATTPPRPPPAVPPGWGPPMAAPAAALNPPAWKPDPMTTPTPPQNLRVFVVHGRNDAAKNSVVLFLTRLGLRPVVLHEEPNEGRSLLAKFQAEAASSAFAVVLMTPDDHGCLIDSQSPAPRARQNVVFELGFFIGSLGPGKVCVLVDATVEGPSDFHGVAYVPFGTMTPWQQGLARELSAAGLPIDAHALLRS
jgi:predicted nucleotide-binding protein